MICDCWQIHYNDHSDFLVRNYYNNIIVTMQPMMNNIESCAVDYLYRTRDCEFAKRVVNATNGELSDVARMIVENNFPIRAPKWMDIPRKKCK